MADTMWPLEWEFTKHEFAEDMVPGDRLPGIMGKSRHCQNCGAGDGFVFSFMVGNYHDQTYILSRDGESYGIVKGRLESHPCPVCNQAARVKWLVAQSGMMGISLEGKQALELRVDEFRPRIEQKDALEKVLAILQELNDKPHSWFLIYGSNGVGKTHLLLALLNACRKANIWSHYTTTQIMLSKIRSTYKNHSLQTAEQVAGYYEKIPILAIDELDRIKWSEAAGADVVGIVEARHRNGLPTWFASNKSPTELEQYAEPLKAIVSRARGGYVVGIGKDDLRPEFAWQGYTE